MITKDDLDVMVFALRYAVRRKTYAPYIVCKYIRDKVPQMSFNQREQLIWELRNMGMEQEFIDDIAANEAHDLLMALHRAHIDDEGGKVYV